MSLSFINGVYMSEKEKIDLLASNFRKLEEGGKDYIRELTRKLADIHCNGGYRDTTAQKSGIAFPNTRLSKGVFL